MLEHRKAVLERMLRDGQAYLKRQAPRLQRLVQILGQSVS